MKKKKGLLERFNNLSMSRKVQVVIASLLSIFIVIAVPAYAWFSYVSRIETLTKIKAPSTLDIKSGHAYHIQYLDLSDIDVTEVDDGVSTGHKDYIFSVKAGTRINAYDIQIAHTTNIPFEYELYRASELGDSNTLSSVPAENVATFEYKPENATEITTFYYGYASGTADASKLSLTHLNPDDSAYGRQLAKKNDENSIYPDYTQYGNNDNPEIYAVPLYSQHKNIAVWDPEADYFILRLTWDTSANGSFADWNAAANNKETDVIYISAKASASQ